MARRQLWRLFEQVARAYEPWYDTRPGQRADQAERGWWSGWSGGAPGQRRCSRWVRVSRRGLVVLALNRWSLGGLSRRWGPARRGAILAHAHDTTILGDVIGIGAQLATPGPHTTA